MVFYAASILGILGLIMGFGLAVAFKKLSGKTDVKLEEIITSLPGTNCGACGFAGCLGYAKAITEGKVKPDLCSAGGEEVAKKVSKIMGVELIIRKKKVALVRCRGGSKEAKEKFDYQGIEDCRAVLIVAGGKKECRFGCLGLATCVKSCPFEAIYMGENGLPVILEERCVGCGRCVASCPRGIIELVERSQPVLILCRSNDKGKEVKSLCQVGCIGCGLCLKACTVRAIKMEENLPRIDPALCMACGECVKKCPTHSIYFLKDVPGRKEKQIPMDKLIQSSFDFKKKGE